MSLTKQALQDKIKPTFRWVDVEGFGRIGVRTVPYVQAAMREASYSDPKTGYPIPEQAAMRGIHQLIDQVMVDEKTPMFTEEDETWLSVGDPTKMAPLFAAVDAIDADEKKKAKDG